MTRLIKKSKTLYGSLNEAGGQDPNDLNDHIRGQRNNVNAWEIIFQVRRSRWEMKSYEERKAYAEGVYNAGLRKVASTPPPKDENAKLRAALEEIILMQRRTAHDQCGNAEKAEAWACVRTARAALTKKDGE